jgi:surface antigen
MAAVRFAWSSIAALTALLGACAQPGTSGNAPGQFGANKTTGGALVGGAAGGLVGSQFGSGSGQLAATGLGVLAGALAGSSVGASLDRADLAYAQQAEQSAFEAAPSGTATTWRNPDTGNSGTITPQAAVQDASGQYCREFQQTITVGGQTQQGYGTACRQPSGSWQIVR